jgi:hypothetical protein
MPRKRKAARSFDPGSVREIVRLRFKNKWATINPENTCQRIAEETGIDLDAVQRAYRKEFPKGL